MRKIKHPNIGEYLFCSRWSDADPSDPWFVGFVERIIIEKNKTYVQISGQGRWWPHFWRITKEEGNIILNNKDNFWSFVRKRTPEKRGKKNE